MSVFVHAQGIKTVHARGGGQKMAKFCPRSCCMPHNAVASTLRNANW